MNYNNKFIPYFIKKRFLSEEECNYIINKGMESIESIEATLFNRKRNRFFDLDITDPLFIKISDLINKVNSKYYNFDMEISNSVELYTYQSGDFFDYHMDLYKGSASRRKLTFLILLSNGDEYDGGDLEFFSNIVGKLPRVKGTIAIYPSFIMHKVTSLTKGIRYSLGGECLGEPFR